jgi:uncharacterized protein YkwD
MSDYSSHPQYAFDLIALINEYRASQGVQPLVVDHILMDLSQGYTEYLKTVGTISHTADGKYPWTRIKEAGFVHEDGLTGSGVGNENIHFGYSSRDGWDDPQEALEGWIGSSGHNRNMLNPDWDRVGVGYKDGLYTANFGNAPDGSSGSAGPGSEPQPVPAAASFSSSQAVTVEVPQAGRAADFARITLGDVVDQNQSTATVRFQALLDGKVVASGSADVREPGGTVKFDPAQDFDAVRVTAGESDVTGKVTDVKWTLLDAAEPAPEPNPEPEPAPEPEPEPAPATGSFDASRAVTFDLQEQGRLADYARIKLGSIVDPNGSAGMIRFEALDDGRVVATGSANVAEPGATVRFDPQPGFDAVRVKASESDVTGIVLDVDWFLLDDSTPSEPTTPDPTAPSPSPLHEFEQRVIELTNAERAKQGLAPLKSNAELNEAADRHAEDMSANNYFSHTGRDGDRAWDRGEEVGYSSSGYGENIARGHRTPEQVVEGWMNSSGHRANILNSSWKDIGVGFENYYWVQNFGTGDTNPDSFLM